MVFSTKASVSTVLTMHPCVSRCLRVKDYKRYFELYLGIGLAEINSGMTIHVCPTQPIPCLLMHWRL